MGKTHDNLLIQVCQLTVLIVNILPLSENICLVLVNKQEKKKCYNNTIANLLLFNWQLSQISILLLKKINKFKMNKKYQDMLPINSTEMKSRH